MGKKKKTECDVEKSENFYEYLTFVVFLNPIHHFDDKFGCLAFSFWYICFGTRYVIRWFFSRCGGWSFIHSFIHSSRSLCYDRSITSSKASSKHPVAAYVSVLVFPSLLNFTPLHFTSLHFYLFFNNTSSKTVPTQDATNQIRIPSSYFV